jgi:FixJ family two-component response regulator
MYHVIVRLLSMNAQDAIVYVVDDDPLIQEALDGLIRSAGLRVRTFASAPDFLRSHLSDAPACLVLDVRLPGQSGLDLQRELAQADVFIPIIFITGHGDIPMSVQALKAGAVDFLTKPFRDQELLDGIHKAIEQDRIARSERAHLAEVRAHFQSLTRREREVMQLVVAGRLNKQIASELGISEVTIKQHRAQVMQKMHAASTAELVRMDEKLHQTN